MCACAHTYIHTYIILLHDSTKGSGQAHGNDQSLMLYWGWDREGGARHWVRHHELRYHAQGSSGPSTLRNSMTVFITGPLKGSLAICGLCPIHLQGNDLGTFKPYEKTTFSSLKGKKSYEIKDTEFVAITEKNCNWACEVPHHRERLPFYRNSSVTELTEEGQRQIGVLFFLQVHVNNSFSQLTHPLVFFPSHKKRI